MINVVIVSGCECSWPPVGCSRRRNKEDVYSRSPVDLGILAIVNNLLDDVEVERLGQVLLDQGDPLLGGHLCHCGQILLGRDGWTRSAESVDLLASIRCREQRVEGLAKVESQK